MPNRAKFNKSLTKDKDFHLNLKKTETTRVLRSNFKRAMHTDRKRKNASVSDGPAPKIMRKTNRTPTDQRNTRNSRYCNHNKKTGTSTNKRAEEKGKMKSLKSESKRRQSFKRNSKIHIKSAVRKNSPTETKSTNKKHPNSRKVKKEKNKSHLMKNVKGNRCSSKSSVKGNSLLNKIISLKDSKQKPPNLTKRPCFRVVGKLKTDLFGFVTTICCVDNDTLWIGRQVFGKLKKVKYLKTGTLPILHTFQDVNFVDFCLDRENNQILFCDRVNKCVMSISSNMEIKVLKCFQPLCATCITVSSDNFIFVGLSNKYAYDCIEQPCPRQIVKIDKNGTIYQRINSLHDGSTNFLFTQRSTINPINNDLLVIGFRNSKEACIANFNSKGINEFLYFGANRNTPFVPRGLTCSNQGTVLVANAHNGDIHILNKNGVCLHLMDMKATGLPEKPWSFSWDFSGHLLIGAMSKPTANILITEYTEHSGDD